jgi:hypothetical protein
VIQIKRRINQAVALGLSRTVEESVERLTKYQAATLRFLISLSEICHLLEWTMTAQGNDDGVLLHATSQAGVRVEQAVLPVEPGASWGSPNMHERFLIETRTLLWRLAHEETGISPVRGQPESDEKGIATGAALLLQYMRIIRRAYRQRMRVELSLWSTASPVFDSVIFYQPMSATSGLVDYGPEESLSEGNTVECPDWPDIVDLVHDQVALTEIPTNLLGVMPEEETQYA